LSTNKTSVYQNISNVLLRIEKKMEKTRASTRLKKAPSGLEEFEVNIGKNKKKTLKKKDLEMSNLSVRYEKLYKETAPYRKCSTGPNSPTAPAPKVPETTSNQHTEEEIIDLHPIEDSESSDNDEPPLDTNSDTQNIIQQLKAGIDTFKEMRDATRLEIEKLTALKLEAAAEIQATVRQNTRSATQNKGRAPASTSGPPLAATGGRKRIPKPTPTSKQAAAGRAGHKATKPPLLNINKLRTQNGMLDEDLNKMLAKHHMQAFLEHDDDEDVENGEFDNVSISDSDLLNACENGDEPLIAAYPHLFVGKIHSRELSFKQIAFQNLDQRTFTIGELDIANKARAANHDCTWINYRQNWHKQLLSFAGKYEWKACLAAHSHILDLIQEGSLQWHDNLSLIAIPIISGHALRAKQPVNTPKFTQRDTTRSNPDKIFCNNYNKAAGCSKNDQHSMLFFGKEVTCHHFCSSCWQKERKVNKHAAVSIDCPYTE